MPSSWADKLNFPLLLVVATAVTGLIWLIDALFFAPKRKAAMRDNNGELPVLVEYAQSFFPVLLVVLVSTLIPVRTVSYPVRFHDSHAADRGFHPRQ